MSIIIISLWMMFVGAVWATWITMSNRDLGVVTVIVGAVVLFLEVVLPGLRRG